ncbi:hypothetical protein T4C_10568 [Trichinella pseudospiralis]|uniref:Uncharacterized protein n=1 Tax=Trichinella pseudospiralis TaxID=6337 RepID=A0A0V1K0N5_TRIPS|nr:hypothetical protein T4C_10568 [Trichinella pseudospiralis]
MRSRHILFDRGLNFQACFSFANYVSTTTTTTTSSSSSLIMRPDLYIVKWCKLMPFSGLSKRIALK